jgi:hypothetical protein
MRRAKQPMIGAGTIVLLALAAPVSAESGGNAASGHPLPEKGAPKTPAAAAPTSPPAAPAPPAEQAKPRAPPDATTTVATDKAVYAVKLQDLEQRIDELKEQVRRRDARNALRDSFSHGGIGSRLSIHFESALSRVFVVTGVRLVLDGAVQYAKNDPTGSLGGPSGIAMFSGSVPPGDHVVQMLVELQGNGLGVFSYLRGYRFQVRSTYSFSAIEGKTIDLDALTWEKGDLTTPFERRPAVRYTEKVVDDQVSAPAGARP